MVSLEGTNALSMSINSLFINRRVDLRRVNGLAITFAWLLSNKNKKCGEHCTNVDNMACQGSKD